ncbi:MAG TPA: hypothetical protein VN733_03445, partial [Solirubrobacterales bacterium]|nr:hypothetical protein [Solirubrobacterales bacterium]
MHGRAGTVIEKLRGELDESLFRPADPAALRIRGREALLVLVPFLVLAAALQLLRAGPEDSLKALFAEDGTIFLGGALTHGTLDSLTTPYPEYLVFLPRLIAELATIVPLRFAPEAMNLCAVLLVAVSALAVWVASAGLIRTTWLRAVLVALVLLPPASGLETVVSTTNVIWYTTFAVFWLLLWRPETTRGAVLAALLILAAGLSSPTFLFFAPLAALRAIAVRDRRDGLIVGAFALAAAIQLPVTLLAESPFETEPMWSASVLTTFLQRVVAGSALGLELGGEAWAEWGWTFLVLISLAVAAALAALAARASAGRLFALVAVATAVVMFLASGYQRALGPAMVWYEGGYNSLGGRYAMVPALLIASAAL